MYLVAVNTSPKNGDIYEFETKKDALSFMKEADRLGFYTAISKTKDKPKKKLTRRKKS